jgi:formate hydrogenlyase subunit 6/NADH:ubiquinone oxidoreductase subunit I
VHGQRIDEMRLIGFVPPSAYSLSTGILALGPVKGIMRRLFIGRPVPLKGTCVMCGQCRKICPARAIADFRTEDAVPRFDYGKCIRCWCCMEACPHYAIEVRKGALHRLMR